MYKAIAEQRDVFDLAPQRFNTEIVASFGNKGNVSDDTEFIWLNRLNKGGGGVLKHTNPNFQPSTKGRYSNEFLPAYEDISKFENSDGVNEKKIVLHRMGYGRSYGIRDLTVFNQDGSYRLISYGKEGENRKLDGKLNTNLPFHEAIAKYFIDYLKEAPDATFFVHTMGTEVNFSATESLFEFIYDMIGHDCGEVTIPAEQIDNVNLLLFLMDLDTGYVIAYSANLLDDLSKLESNKKTSNICRRMFSYSYENDPAEYWVFAGGRFLGFNNKRAIPNYLKLIDKKMPNAPVLVYRMGDIIDFDLEKRIREIDVKDGRVKRNRKRLKVS